MAGQSVLPDYLVPGLRIVFCGTAPGVESARRQHYYAGPGNEFWVYLYEAGLTPFKLAPEEDATITKYALGLTDIAKRVARSQDTTTLRQHFDVPGFVAKMERFAPEWVAFQGKAATGAAVAVARHLRQGSAVRLGVQPWQVVGCSVFVVPSPSGSNRNPRYLDGRPNRVAWFRELADASVDSHPT